MGGISMLVILGILSAIYTFFLAVFVVFTIFLLVGYIFESLAIYAMGSYKTLSWIPFLNKYCLGCLAKKRIIGLVLAVVDLVAAVLGGYLFFGLNYSALLFFVLIVLMCISLVLNIILSHQLFKERSARFGDVYTILSVLSLGLLRPVFMFVLRNKHNYSSWY